MKKIMEAGGEYRKFWLIILSFIIIPQINCYAQNKNQSDSARYIMKDFLDSLNVSFHSNSKLDNIRVIPFGRIKAQNQVYYVYVFGSKLDLHKSINYILFYNVTLTNQNKILGHDGLNKDIKFLNEVYKQSKQFKKATFTSLIDLLIEDYTPSGKEGKGVRFSK